jgi:hypothetical protein
MSVDLSKLELITTFDAFKNAAVYTGSLTLPASVPPATVSVPVTQSTTSFTVTDKPIFSTFFAYFVETLDAILGNNNPQWYNAQIAGQGYVAYPISGGQVNCYVYPVININTVTITCQAVNQTATTYSANISVPYAFVGYTLAN